MSRSEQPAVPVTVAIPTANRPGALRRCLAAVLAGDCVPAQIIVVDQSQDGASRDLVASLPYRDISLLHVPDRATGLSAARNLALSRATSDIVAFIDDDCVAGPGWLSAVHSGFARTASLPCVCGPILPLGPERPGTYAVSSRTSMEARTHTGSVVPWLAGSGGNLSVRRSRLPEGRLFNPLLGTGSPGRAGEDIDLLRRLLREGHAIFYCPEAIVFHERQSLERRLRSRFGYGHGIGAASGLWLRSGDRYGLRMLMQWLRMRLGMGVVALRHRRARALVEEALVLAGTLRGLVYGTARDRRASA